jgi:hypothetical protein
MPPWPRPSRSQSCSRRQAPWGAGGFSSRGFAASRTPSTSAKPLRPRRRATCTSGRTARRRRTRGTGGALRAFREASRGYGRRGTRSARGARRGRSCSRLPSSWPIAASRSTPPSRRRSRWCRRGWRNTPRRQLSFSRAALPPSPARRGGTLTSRTCSDASPSRGLPGSTRARSRRRSLEP